MDKKYDFIFIGSGMGSLVSANILAKEGHSVLVLEKNPQFGGSLQTFSRDKCIFDTGVHYIGSLNEGENLDKIFKYIGIKDKLDLQKLDKDAFDIIRLPNGVEISLGQGNDNFKKLLIQAFPDEEQAIIKFCDKVLEVCSYFPLYNLRIDSKKNYLQQPEILEIDAWDYVCSLTENKELRAAFLGNGPLYAGEKNITPFYVVALILNSYINGSYRIINGGSQLTKSLVSVLKENGGGLKKRQNVIGAEYQDKKIICVVTDTGEKFYATNFISNMHPLATINTFGEEKFIAAYRNRIKKLNNTIAAFTLYISLKENSFPYYNHNFYDYYVDSNKIWDITDYDTSEWPNGAYICTPAKKNQGKYADSLSVLTYMRYDEVKKWEGTFNTVGVPGERGDEYEQFKKRKEEQLMKKLKEKFPKLRESIKNIYSSTPLTYKNYIGTEDGSLYGIKKNVNNVSATIINSRTKIPNLFLTGQNLIFHGILGATIGGLVCCFNFLDNEVLISKINEQK